jgi:4-hydroxy-2-oxoheptanedioate aldolase
MNKVKQKLAAREVVTMFNPDYPSPRLLEYVAAFGLDVAFIDAERQSYDFERIEEMARAARAAGITSVARPWMNDPGLITRYLDCGVGGIKVPHVEDAKTARAMLDIVRYARPQDHAEKIVVIMVETPAAIANIGEIAEVPGIDVINIGTNDVAAAAGHQGEPEHPKVQALVDDAIGRILKGGKTVGLNVMSNWEKRIPYFYGKGVRWFNVHANTFITRGANQYNELLKQHCR